MNTYRKCLLTMAICATVSFSNLAAAAVSSDANASKSNKSKASGTRKRKSANKEQATLVGVGQPCPQCGKEMIAKEGRYGQFVACPGYPGCRYIHKA